jgi:hypothetical protein
MAGPGYPGWGTRGHFSETAFVVLHSKGDSVRVFDLGEETVRKFFVHPECPLLSQVGWNGAVGTGVVQMYNEQEREDWGGKAEGVLMTFLHQTTMTREQFLHDFDDAEECFEDFMHFWPATACPPTVRRPTAPGAGAGDHAAGARSAPAAGTAATAPAAACPAAPGAPGTGTAATAPAASAAACPAALGAPGTGTAATAPAAACPAAPSAPVTFRSLLGLAVAASVPGSVAGAEPVGPDSPDIRRAKSGSASAPPADLPTAKRARVPVAKSNPQTPATMSLHPQPGPQSARRALAERLQGAAFSAEAMLTTLCSQGITAMMTPKQPLQPATPRCRSSPLQPY